MAPSIEQLLHDLANRVMQIGSAGWIVLTNSEDESVYPLMNEIERAMNIVRSMQDAVRKQEADYRRRESA